MSPSSSSSLSLRRYTELAEYSWECHPNTVAKMLSPKRVKRDRKGTKLEDFDCLIDNEFIESALEKGSEGVSTNEEVNSTTPLSAIIQHCNAVYDVIATSYQERGWCFTFRGHTERKFDSFESFRYDGHFSGCLWHFSSNWNQRPIKSEIEQEYSNDWADLLLHAGTLAYQDFVAAPLRAFSLFSALNYASQELRFLIFHHGGLTTSHALDIRKGDDQVGIIKVVLSIMLWQDPVDAGFPPFSNSRLFYLPCSKGDATPQLALFRDVLYHSPSLTGRNTWVTRVSIIGNEVSGNKYSDYMDIDDYGSCSYRPWHVHPAAVLSGVSRSSVASSIVVKCSWTPEDSRLAEPLLYSSCDGLFGNHRHIGSFEPCFEDDYPISNAVFLPPTAETARNSLWSPLFPSTHPLGVLKKHSLWVTMLGDEGESFENCTDAWDLCECMLHAMLGWLLMYQEGYLHRDVSIGNVLKLKRPSERQQFSTRRVVNLLVQNTSVGGTCIRKGLVETHHGDNDEFWNRLRANVKDQDAQELIDVAQELEKEVKALGVTNICKAVIADGDLSVRLSTYFQPDQLGSVPSVGTPEFKSSLMVNAEELRMPYAQTPLDDFYSFQAVSAWATLFNKNIQNDSWRENSWRSKLTGSAAQRDGAIHDLSRPAYTRDLGLSSMVRGMALVHKGWAVALDKMLVSWENAECGVKYEGQPFGTLVSACHLIAYRGVLEFAKLLSAHRTTIQSFSLSC